MIARIAIWPLRMIGKPLDGIPFYGLLLLALVAGGMCAGLRRFPPPLPIPNAADLIPLVPLGLAVMAFSQAGFVITRKKKAMLSIGGMDFDEAHVAGHFLITGATRSGKTAAAIKPMLLQLFQRKVGGIALAVKSNFADIVENLAEATGCRDQVIRLKIQDNPQWRYNPVGDGSLPASLLATRFKAVWKNLGGSTGESIFVEKAVQAIEYAIRFLRLVRRPVTCVTIHDVLMHDSGLAKAMSEFNALGLPETEEKVLVEKFFSETWLTLNPNTKTSIQANIGSLLHPFTDPMASAIFCRDSNFQLSDCRQGKIIVLDIPPSRYGALSKAIAVLIKCDFIDTALRVLETGFDAKALPWQFLLIDEYQEFCTVGSGERGDDATFNIIGETKTIGIISTQGHSEIIAKAGSDTLARPIYNNLTNKIYFRAGDKLSATKAVEEVGARSVTETNRSYSSRGGSTVSQSKRKKDWLSVDQMVNLKPFRAVIKRNDGHWTECSCAPLDDCGRPFAFE